MSDMTGSASIVSILQDVLGKTEKVFSLHEPLFAGKEKNYVTECIDTGWVSSVGSYVDLFEKNLAEKCGVSHAVVTVNGTAALHVALMLAGVARDEEVLVPSLTFVATANAVSYCGAVPHFIECEEKTLGIDSRKLAVYLEEIGEQRAGGFYNKKTGRRIACVVPVHVLGHPVDMDRLHKAVKPYGLSVIADGAESLGSFYKGRPVEASALVTSLSFNGNKIITTGGGGAVLTDDEELARQAKYMTTTAKQSHQWAFIHDFVGYNYRMPNINAALGCAQLEQLDDFLKIKRELAGRYESAFAESKVCRFFKEPEHCQSNYWLNAVILEKGEDREKALADLHDAGFMCRPLWTLMNELPMYKDCPCMDLAISEDMEGRIICLPSSACLGRSS